MDSEPSNSSTAANANAATDKSARERTQIEFPYTDISQAEGLAKHLMERGGGSAEPDQLAAWMDQSANGGTFRSRLSAARMFGLIETERGGIRITQDGRDILDSEKTAAVRVAAFLRIPLFNAMYDKNKGYALPPAAAIERQMVELGVPLKQKERARQVFQKSAAIAHFVDPASGRFTKPPVSEKFKEADPSSDNSRDRNGGDDAPPPPPSKPEQNPFITGLLGELPAGDQYANWKIEDQAEWLTAAASIFKLLSKAKGRIEITAHPEKQTPNG